MRVCRLLGIFGGSRDGRSQGCTGRDPGLEGIGGRSDGQPHGRTGRGPGLSPFPG